MAASSILYYPSIHFRDEDWVKRALLYWDSVYRIVPVRYNPHDSDFIRRLKGDDLVRDIILDKDDDYDGIIERTAFKFLQLATGPNRPFGLRITDDQPIRPEDSNEFVNIYDNKVYNTLGELFVDEGLATHVNSVYNMSARLGGYYMMMLAKEIASHRNIPMGTDSKDVWAVTPVFNYLGQVDSPTNENAVEMLSSLVIKDIFPKDLSNISTDFLISQKKYRKDARKALRGNVTELVEKLKNVHSIEQIKDELHDFKKNLEESKREFRESQSFWKDVNCWEGLCTTVPTFATIYSGFGSSSNSAGLGFILSAIQFITNRFGVKKKENNSFQSYLLGIDQAAAKAISGETRVQISEMMDD